jgi:Predicted exosome subunit/U3 small nucleolar ribonucleoprotein (snoRNP) component, contains IMP4 domain
MTIVTSSRKPSNEVRKLAKEIAFSLGFPYIQRGKAGIRELGAENPRIIFISGTKRLGPVFDVTVNGETVFSMLMSKITESERTGPFKKGFITREPDLYKFLSPHIPIELDENAEGAIVFYGTQKKQYVLQVMV